MGGGASKTSPVAAEASKLFGEIDTNKDGKLSIAELVDAAERYGGQIGAAWPMSRILAVLDQHDKNNDGMLDAKEWSAALVALEVAHNKSKGKSKGKSAAVTTALSQLPDRRPCKYGADCYQKSPQHRTQFSHTGDTDYLVGGWCIPCRTPRNHSSAGMLLTKAAEDMAAALLASVAGLDRSARVTPKALGEATQVLSSRVRCQYQAKCTKSDCRYAHGDAPLWDVECCADLIDPSVYRDASPSDLRSSKSVRDLFGQQWNVLGEAEFLVIGARQQAALAHFNTRVGASIVCHGLPSPDELQSLAISRVADVWGEQVVLKAECQEYLDRSAAKLQSRITGTQYSPPSRASVRHHLCGCIHTARVVKIAISNPKIDFTDTDRETCWHGCKASGLDGWRPVQRNTPPTFRVDKNVASAWGKGIYISPSFEQAVCYGYGWDPSDARYAVHTTKDGATWKYMTIMEVAIYDAGKAGVVDKNAQTWPGAPADGWQHGELEWVVRDANKAQIYGILFLFFTSDC